MQKIEAIDMMELNNIFGSIQQNADKVGLLLGFFTGSPNGLNDVQAIIQEAMAGHIHMPNIGDTLKELPMDMMMTGAWAWIIGYIAEEAKLPIIGRYGTALQKAGFGYMTGVVAQKLAWKATH